MALSRYIVKHPETGKIGYWDFEEVELFRGADIHWMTTQVKDYILIDIKHIKEDEESRERLENDARYRAESRQNKNKFRWVSVYSHWNIGG